MTIITNPGGELHMTMILFKECISLALEFLVSACVSVMYPPRQRWDWHMTPDQVR